MLRSGRHDDAFYQRLLETLHAVGIWQGEIVNRRKNGEIYPQYMTVRTVCDGDGKLTHYVCITSDLSSQKKSESEREWLAHHDPLTRLPNRLLGTSRLNHAIEQSRQNQRRLALICMDMDQLKTINDSLGHPVGDSILSTLASRLREQLSGKESISRLGGDEFMVMLEDLKEPDEVVRTARRILDIVHQPFILEDQQKIYVSASLGISFYPEDGQNANSLLQHADAAMYQCKRQGRDGFCFYTSELGEQALLRLKMQLRIREGIERNEFYLHYQPQLDVATRRVTGVEALIRWRSPELGALSPASFIPIAEQTNLILPIGAWVLQEACRQSRRWQEEQGLPPVTMAVNVSVRQFQARNLVGVVENALKESGLDPCHLEIEVTESVFMEDVENAIATCQRLHEMGVRLSLDDFGTGYSSLAYLSRMPFDKIKIDRSFVQDITSNPTNAAIANATIALAQNLNMAVLAEGVEEEAQLDFLYRNGCAFIQGFLFSRPLTPEACAELIRVHTMSV